MSARKNSALTVLLLAFAVSVAADDAYLVGNKLLDAAGQGKTDEVLKILSEGGDANFANEFGERAVHLTAISSNTEILGHLISAGADVSKPTNGVYQGHAEPVRRTPLMWHVHGCQLQAVKMLIEAGADLNYRNEEGETALDIVSAFDQTDSDCRDITNLIKEKGGKVKGEL